jgi:two-component system NarL family response regulator
VAAGKSNQEIAGILYIAAGTVRVHVHAILQKLEVRDRPLGGSGGASPMAGTSCHRTQAAVLAIHKGLVAKELLQS